MAFALPPQRPEQPAPVASQVNLNVVAMDAKGQPVSDLTADELRIWDNGKEQKIASFRRREVRATSAASLGPRQYSNRPPGMSPHATVILFDQLNTHFADRGYVMNRLTHVLGEYEKSSNLYLYLLTEAGSLYAVRGLPTSETPAPPWPEDIQGVLNAAVRATLTHRTIDLEVDIDARVRTTLTSLSMMAARLAAVPGRKNIVWLTHGIPISLGPNRTVDGEVIDYTPWVRELSNTLDRADVSIYAVQQSPPGSITTDAGASTRGGAADATAPTGMGSEETLQEFARLTGGRAYENNDIAGAIKQAVNDAQESYLISYVPPAENWDGKFHKIRITCARKGVKLQARQGYFAFADQAASPRQEADAVNAAIRSPFDAAEIGLRATARMQQNGDKPAVAATIRIELGDIHLDQSGQTYTGRLSARFVAYRNDGSILQTKPTPMELRLTAEQHDSMMKRGFELNQGVDLDPKVEKLRFIVFDEVSSAIGSITIPVTK